MYADDCKIYRKISNDDKIKLQEDIDSFQKWCLLNELEVNSDKCASIIFTRKKLSGERQYSLNGTNLRNERVIRDLGVDFSSSLGFSEHIGRVVSNALKILGFIRRFSNDFKDAKILKILYCSLFELI